MLNKFCKLQLKKIMITAHIITIGDEILIGQILDRNSAWIAELLHLSGIKVAQITSISDSPKHIIDTLAESIGKYNVVLVTGGLGPTKDDLTKQTLADFFNTKLVLNEKALSQIEKILSGKNIEMNELNKTQALLPESAKILINYHGTASGMWFEKKETVVVSMPGVPFEMKPMFSEQVLPLLKQHIKTQAIYFKTVLTQGIPESELAMRIADWENQLPEFIKLAYLPQPGIVRLRLSAQGDSLEALKQFVNAEIDKLKTILKNDIFGYDEDLLEEIVGRLLFEKRKTVATAESCTGGYVAHLITSVPGASSYFNGSIVAYSNDIKEQVLGVKKNTLLQYGAVSEQTVLEMAMQVKKQMNVDYAIAVSGISGPTGGTVEKPVGTTWIAIASPQGVKAYHFVFGDHRERNIRRAALKSLNLLRVELLKD